MNEKTQTPGFLAILSAPSGAGKSTLARHLVATGERVRVSVSTTTRNPRPGEREGEHYHFVDKQAFEEKIRENAFLEWAEVFGNYYGTSRETVAAALNRGEVLLLDIDWQGARQVRRNMPPGDVISIAILPPSREALQHRLQERGQDTPETIARRMSEAGREISHWHEYDYLLVNADLAEAQAGLAAIITAERLKKSRADIRRILQTFPGLPDQAPTSG